jgi:GMP synthase (glutamine-hydrolysing)
MLSIVHEASPTEGGGHFEELATARSDAHDRWLASAGPPPAEPDVYDGVMVFGGPVHPDQDDRHPWLAQETEYLRAVSDAGVPMLGVCLGAQLVARALGGQVARARRSEIGWHPIELTDDGISDPIVGTLPRRVVAFQWHSYCFELPPGACLLAENGFGHQAFRAREHVWGIQFHAEVTRKMIESWCVKGAESLPKPLAQVAAETDLNLPRSSAWGNELCSAFLDHCASPLG